MSVYGQKIHKMNILSWSWWKSLDEYADQHEQYKAGWTLNIKTLFGTLTVEDFGWPRRFHNFRLASVEIAYGTLYLLGYGISYDKPGGLVQTEYTGDAHR